MSRISYNEDYDGPLNAGGALAGGAGLVHRAVAGERSTEMTRRDTTHRCAVPSCGRAIPRDRLMCFADWSKVPKDVQAEVWRAWRAFLADISMENMQQHERAKALAVASLSETREALPREEN